MDKTFDTIVLGLGATGSAALCQLAKKGNKVLGIDRFSPPHSYGSSHGDTRITRQAIGEGEQYTPLSLRSYELWREFERETGRDLLRITGGLIISSKTVTMTNHVPDFFQKTLAAAKKHDIRHELLDAAQIRARFPQFHVSDDEKGYYEYNAGFLRPEECIRAQLSLAEKNGAVIHQNEKLLHFSEKSGGVQVKTDQGTYEAGRVIVCLGPWLPEFLDRQYTPLLKVARQVLFWFDVKTDVARFQPENFPVFIWELQGEKMGIYGFPAVDGASGGVKIATEQYVQHIAADAVKRDVSAEEKRNMYRDFVAPYFPALSDRCVKAVSCLYTVTPDAGFIIDAHPDYPSVLLASPCSGHGFKHSAAIGEMLAEIVVDGDSKLDRSGFRLGRFKV